MRSRDPLQVVVIDNVARFALYVWRYLSRSIGFGIGDLTDPGRTGAPFWKGGEPTPLSTPAGDALVWWINAEGWIGRRTWRGQIERVLERLDERGGERLFLVDVRGPYHSLGKGAGPSSFRDALAYLQERSACLPEKGSSEVMLVSSYHTGPYSMRIREQEVQLRVFPKSPETMGRLWKRLLESQQRSVKASIQSMDVLHVLVTGAGFEVKDHDLGCRRLGTRRTAEILRDSLTEVFGSNILDGYHNKNGFCIPAKHRNARGRGMIPGMRQRRERLMNAAEKGNLDDYWDELLTLELLDVLETTREGRPEKGRASQNEYRLRDAFRRQFVADDWGYLNQALSAARAGFTAWLTTNYTRFADRAIEMSAKPWRVVSTANEAERLLQELLHSSVRSHGAEQDPEYESGEAFLFKLHGDLAHLLTMAIAGHDKEIFSPLGLPISSLNSIYTAAEQYLEHRVERCRPVVWHIVGHGLKDRLLVRLICEVESSSKADQTFLVVSPFKPEEAGEVREFLRKKLRSERQIRTIQLFADEYMARLDLMGLPDQQGLDGWLQHFPILSSADPEAKATKPSRSPSMRRSREPRRSGVPHR